MKGDGRAQKVSLSGLLFRFPFIFISFHRISPHHVFSIRFRSEIETEEVESREHKVENLQMQLLLSAGGLPLPTQAKLYGFKISEFTTPDGIS